MGDASDTHLMRPLIIKFKEQERSSIEVIHDIDLYENI